MRTPTVRHRVGPSNGICHRRTLPLPWKSADHQVALGLEITAWLPLPELRRLRQRRGDVLSFSSQPLLFYAPQRHIQTDRSAASGSGRGSPAPWVSERRRDGGAAPDWLGLDWPQARLGGCALTSNCLNTLGTTALGCRVPDNMYDDGAHHRNRTNISISTTLGPLPRRAREGASWIVLRLDVAITGRSG